MSSNRCSCSGLLLYCMEPSGRSGGADGLLTLVTPRDPSVRLASPPSSSDRWFEGSSRRLSSGDWQHLWMWQCGETPDPSFTNEYAFCLPEATIFARRPPLFRSCLLRLLYATDSGERSDRPSHLTQEHIRRLAGPVLPVSDPAYSTPHLQQRVLLDPTLGPTDMPTTDDNTSVTGPFQSELKPSMSFTLPGDNVQMTKRLLSKGSQLYTFEPARAVELSSSVYSTGFPCQPEPCAGYLTPIGTRGYYLGTDHHPVVSDATKQDVRTLGLIDSADNQQVLKHGSGHHGIVSLYPPMQRELDVWTHHKGWSASYLIGEGKKSQVFLRVPSGRGSYWAHIWSADDLKHALTLQPSQDKRTGWGWDGNEELRRPFQKLPSQGLPFARHVDDGKTISVALIGEGEEGTEVVAATVIKPGCTPVM